MKTRRALPIAAGLLCCLAIASTTSAGSLPRNWPLAPSELERRFAHDEFQVREAKGAGSGVTGAMKLRIEYRDGKTLDVKWKTAPRGKADGFNNSPRKELAAYELQKWIFEENDYLVPTVALHCLPVAIFRVDGAKARPTLDGTTCVLGTIAVWLQDVEAPKDFYDKGRFASDPLYARSVADVNLLTYLIGHRDAHSGNFLLSNDPANPRVFAVDNGLAFDLLPWNLRVTNWFRIRVPWLSRETVDRLRKVDKAKLRELAVVAELEADTNGILHPVPPGPRLHPDRDERVRRAGSRVQFGLDKDEIDDVGERIEKLLKKVDSGEQPVR